MTNQSHPYIFLIALWPIAFIGIWAIWNAVRESRDAKLVGQSLAWPEAQGRVITSRVVWAHVEVSYEYLANGYLYTGRYKSSLTPVAPDRYGRGAAAINSEAKQELVDFPPGANLIIRYNPQKPSQSVLYCRGEAGKNTSDRGADLAPKFGALS